jgi:hypothetical protein
MFEGPTGANRKMVFHVTLSRPAPQAMTVDWQTVAGSALAGTDFTADDGTLSFAPGETHKTVRVTVRGNGGAEPDEEVTLQLSAPTNRLAVEAPVGVGTILDDDRGLRVAFGNCLVVEGAAGSTQTCAMPLMVSRKPQRTLTVDWRTRDATATVAEADYVSAQKAAKVSKSRTVQVKVRGDAQVEPTEWFRAVIVSINRDAVKAASPGRVIVVNDDPPAP